MDLDRAVEQEQKIVDALTLIGAHYAALESGKDVAKTREELRKQEDETAKATLDERDASASEIAELSEKSADEQLKDLEKKLNEAENDKMRDELKDPEAIS